MFEIPKDPCIAVVVDPSHPRFGEIACVELSESDADGFGETVIAFNDGTKAALRNGLAFEEPDLPQVRIFSKTDTGNISAFIERLPKIRSALIRICAVADRKSCEHLFLAKQEFWDTLCSASR